MASEKAKPSTEHASGLLDNKRYGWTKHFSKKKFKTWNFVVAANSKRDVKQTVIIKQHHHYHKKSFSSQCGVDPPSRLGASLYHFQYYSTCNFWSRDLACYACVRAYVLCRPAYYQLNFYNSLMLNLFSPQFNKSPILTFHFAGSLSIFYPRGIAA